MINGRWDHHYLYPVVSLNAIIITKDNRHTKEIYTMPSFHHNPYTQPPRPSPISAEESLKHLLRMNHQSLNPPPTTSIQSILDRIMVQPDAIDWSIDLAQGLTALLLTVLDPFLSSPENKLQQIPDGSLGTFFLLASAMEEWSDDLVYMTILQEVSGRENPKSLLDVLIHLAVSGNDDDDDDYYYSSMQRIAIVALGTAYRSMDRLQQHLMLDPYRPDVSWWLASLDEERSSKLTSTAMKILRESSETSNVSSQLKPTFIPKNEQIQLGAMSCLCTILKRDQMDSLGVMDENDLGDLCHQSLRRLQALINPQLPFDLSRWHLPSSLMSVVLLSLIQWRHDVDLSDYDRIVHSTTLVENVTTFVFSLSATSTRNGHEHQDSPRWTYDGASTRSRIFGVDVISSWALAGGAAWTMFIKQEKDWQPGLERFWNDAATIKTQSIAAQLALVECLHHSCRLISRGSLFSILQHFSTMDHGTHAASTTNLLAPLFDLFQSPDASVQIQAVCLVRSLLSDRRSLSTHDDVSRAFWSWIDDSMAKQVIQMVVHLSKSQEAKRPLLLALLDLLDTLLQDQAHCDMVLTFLSAESLELMIGLVEPKKVKFDYKDASGWDDLSLDFVSETPPANNLSRMDENSICFEQEEENSPRGVDTTIQLATATALARMGYSYSSSTEEGVHLLKSRICTAVNNFVTHFLSEAGELAGSVSFDTNKRSFRLQVAVAASENEDFMATALFSKHILSQKRLAQISNDKERAKLELQSVEKHAKNLEEQNARLVNQNRSQSIIFKREMSRIKENTSQDAKQLVAIHATERSTAESRVVECVRRLEETQSELQNSRLEAEESQRTVNLTKEELQNALTKATLLENEKRDLSRQIDKEEARARVLQEEMHSQTEKLNSLFRTRQELEDELQERNQAVQDYKTTNENLRDNLEELFADMVSLIKVYEVKENEVANLQRNHFDEVEQTGKKLRRAQERNEELTSTVDQLRHENDKLYKKLAKYKERLEDERRERQEEVNRRKRNGPVSYINQLHQSTASDRSAARDKSTTRKESGSNMSRSRSDKENVNSYDSESQRRRNY